MKHEVGRDAKVRWNPASITDVVRYDIGQSKGFEEVFGLQCLLTLNEGLPSELGYSKSELGKANMVKAYRSVLITKSLDLIDGLFYKHDCDLVDVGSPDGSTDLSFWTRRVVPERNRNLDVPRLPLPE